MGLAQPGQHLYSDFYTNEPYKRYTYNMWVFLGKDKKPYRSQLQLNVLI